MSRFTWTDESVAALLEMHAANASHADIAAALGCSKATVSRKLANDSLVGFAPCAPCAPAAPAAEVEAPAPCAPAAPAAAEQPAPALPQKSRVTVTVEAMRRPEGVTVTELAALFAAEFDGNGKLSTASQAIYKAPKARGLTPRNTGEKREGRAVYKID